jgi:polyvinyl alcohol dehydrogenase (cytochrome)
MIRLAVHGKLMTALAVAALLSCRVTLAAAPAPQPPVTTPVAAAPAATPAVAETAEQAPAAVAPHPGDVVFAQNCASCHLGQVPRAPHKMFLEMMATDAIFASLDAGIMRSHGEKLTATQKHDVARYLGGDKPAVAAPLAPKCTGQAAFFDTRRAPAASGWGITPDNRRYIDAQTAGLTAAELPQLELKWAFAFPGAQRARSQPAIAYGAVYVGSQDGTVYALDEETGCVRWTFRASAEVRTAIVVESPEAARARNGTPVVYFGDLIARVYAVDAFTGALLWMQKVDDHPNATVTAAPALHDGTLYVPVSSLEVTSAADPAYECCTFRGSVLALNATTGTVLWKTYTIPKPPALVGKTRVGTRSFGPSGAPVWNTPAIDATRGMLYVGTGENYSSPADDRSDALLAFRLRDGELAWHAQRTAGDAWNVACMVPDNPNCPIENGPDVDFGAAVIVFDRGAAGTLLLAGQKSGDVYGIDPEQRGHVIWRNKVGRGGIQGGVHFGMATDGERLYVPISDMKDEGTGQIKEPSRAGLYALDPATGKLLWSAPADDVCAGRQFCDSGISAAITAMPGAVLAGHMDGRLRAYASATGKLIWEVDTTRNWPTVSGATAHGGSFGGGAGPMVVGGKLFAVSGYGMYYHMPGNVLLVFGKK